MEESKSACSILFVVGRCLISVLDSGGRLRSVYPPCRMGCPLACGTESASSGILWIDLPQGSSALRRELAYAVPVGGQKVTRRNLRPKRFLLCPFLFLSVPVFTMTVGVGVEPLDSSKRWRGAACASLPATRRRTPTPTALRQRVCCYQTPAPVQRTTGLLQVFA